MKNKIINVLVNLFKIKSLVTFATVFVFIYLVINSQIESATVTAIIMMVFQNLFDRSKKESEEKKDE